MLVFVGIMLSVVSLILNILGLAIPYWKYNNSKSYAGLWTSCDPDNWSGITCASIPSEKLDGILQGSRACEMLGMLAIAGAIVFVLLKHYMMKDQKMLLKIGGAFAIVAGALMILGTVIYGTSGGIDISTLHAGFALCIVAGVTALVAGIVLFLAPTDE